jgi:two-component system, LytTR family, response regulator AlgR
MRILIADDEPFARQRLRDLLEADPSIEVVGEASTGREAFDRAAQLRPDAVLLDIAMPVMDGLEAARHMAHLDPPPAVIFCTAYDAHALAAFDSGAIDYLMKPVRAERLIEALQRARRFSVQRAEVLEQKLPATKRRTHLCARLRGSLRLIPIEDIRYLQAEEKYVVVHHANGEDLIEESLKSLEQEFGERFLRIHRNCLVARAELQELQRGPDGHTRAKLRNAPELLEVSRRCLPSLRQQVRSL